MAPTVAGMAPILLLWCNPLPLLMRTFVTGAISALSVHVDGRERYRTALGAKALAA